MTAKQVSPALKNSVEALLFISGEGLSPEDISEGLQTPANKIKDTLKLLVDDYAKKSGGIYLEKKAGKYQFRTSPSVFGNIQAFLKEKKKETLSRAMLEVLAIVAYKQPITQFELSELRGINSRSLVTSLVYKKLIEPFGQKETPGRPSLYRTTKHFLERFSLKTLKELPELKELKELNLEDLE